jgi:penicillin-binding protein 1C
MGALGATAATLLFVYGPAFPEAALSRDHLTSTRIVDRHGRDLREVLSPGGLRTRWTPLDKVSDAFVLATLHAEDERFYAHPGVDPVAIARAALSNASSGRVVSGASTISQQLVKQLLHPHAPRTLALKAHEAILALRLEWRLPKDAILERYLNAVPYGNQLVGVGAASWMYFDKPPAHLTLAEAALLAPVSAAPSARNPYADLDAARARQRRLLDVMLERGAIGAAEHLRATQQPITLAPRRGRVLAPHFTERVLDTLPDSNTPAHVPTTLDLDLQRDAQAIVSHHLDRLADRRVTQAAVVVLDNRDRAVLAYLGSRDYWDAEAQGANDGVTSLRQPGSALKPFVYGEYMARGGGPWDLFDDRPVQFATRDGVYIPENYDRDFHGVVRLRDALGSSLNIPAVLATERIGPDAALAALHRFGLRTLSESPEHYGLGVALGNGEVRLLDLATAYAALADGGMWRPARLRTDVPPGEGARATSPQIAHVLLDILRDDRAREVGFGRFSALHLPFDVAAKTGTSANYRDNWAVGVTPDFTVAVWVGNFDGSPMVESSGVTGAAPIMRQVLQRLYPKAAGRADVPWFTPPDHVRRVPLCLPDATSPCAALVTELTLDATAEPPPESQVHWRHVDRDTGAVTPHATPRTERRLVYRTRRPLVGARRLGQAPRLTIRHPLPNDRFWLDPELPADAQRARLRADIPEHRAGDDLWWYLDGRRWRRHDPAAADSVRLEAGEHTVGLGGPDAPEVEVTYHVVH